MSQFPGYAPGLSDKFCDRSGIDAIERSIYAEIGETKPSVFGSIEMINALDEDDELNRHVYEGKTADEVED